MKIKKVKKIKQGEAKSLEILTEENGVERWHGFDGWEYLEEENGKAKFELVLEKLKNRKMKKEKDVKDSSVEELAEFKDKEVV